MKNTSATPLYNMPPGEQQIEYENPRVFEIHEQLGDFDYLNNSPMTYTGSQDLEERPLQYLDNQAKFVGQWIINTTVREGKGK